jgi:hypothetical protein
LCLFIGPLTECLFDFVSSCASMDMFVLLSWSCRLYTVCVSYDAKFPSTQSWNYLIPSLATLLNLLLAQSTRAKTSMRKSALTLTRRALRSVRLTAVIQALVTLNIVFRLPIIYNGYCPRCYSNLNLVKRHQYFCRSLVWPLTSFFI